MTKEIESKELKQKVIDYLVEEKLRMLAERTIENKKLAIQHLYLSLVHVGLTKWEDVAVNDIKKYFHLKIQKNFRTRRGLALNVVLVKHFLKWLFEQGTTKINLGDSLKFPRLPEVPVECPTPKELADLSQFVWSNDVAANKRAMFLIIRDTGLRSNELRHLQLTDLDFANNAIFVKKTKAKITKYVCFTNETKTAIIDYMNEWAPRKYLFFNPGDEERVLSRYYIYLVVSEIINKWRPDWKGPKGAHTIRHAFATDFIDKTDGNITGLQWMMGWRNITMANRYVHSNPGMIQRAYNDYQKKKKIAEQSEKS